MQALVSIIIPTYNRAHLIGQTLDSVLAQTYENWECIVVDDDSTDYTDELLEFYMEKDSRIRYFHRPQDRPKGANACRNYGFELSKGEFINWLDSDDLMHKNKIEFQVIDLVDQSPYTIGTSRWEYFSSTENLDKLSGESCRKIYKNFESAFNFFEAMGNSQGFLPSHSYLTHRSLVEKAGNWLEDLEINQDGEFFARVLLRAKKIQFSADALVYYRNDNNDLNRVSSIKNIKQAENLIISWILIENYHRLRFKKESNYVKKSKLVVYKRLNSNYSDIIASYIWFFKDLEFSTFRFLVKRALSLNLGYLKINE